MDEIILYITKRLEYLKGETLHAEQSLVNEAEFGRFWEGKLAAINGAVGEVQSLNKLLEMIRDLKKEDPTS